MPRYAIIGEPYFKRDFEAYKLWRVYAGKMPGDIRNFPTRIRNDHQLVEKLRHIKTQAEFARVFGIKDPGTLSDWNMRIDDPKRFNDRDARGTEARRMSMAQKRAEKKLAARKPDIPPADPKPEPTPSRPYERYTAEMREQDRFE